MTGQRRLDLRCGVSGVLLLLAVPLAAQRQEPNPRMEQIAPGVYAIMHADATSAWPNGNTTVIIGDDGVLVVDANFLPSVAAADIAAIRKLTPLPVRYLVNTHWHNDHTQGNVSYTKAFPGVVIVAHHETRKMLDERFPKLRDQYRAVDLAANTGTAGILRQALASGIDDDTGGPLSADKRKLYQDYLAERERAVIEMREFEYSPPTLTFDKNLTIHLGSRRVELLHFLEGNTPGDVVVYLPADKLAVAGDLIVHPVPYAYSGTPTEWIQTMAQLDSLDAAVLVPGHGPVMRDEDYLKLVTRLLESTLAQVRTLIAAGKSLEETREAVDLKSFHEVMVAGDPYHDAQWKASIVNGLIGLTYNELKPAAPPPA